MNFLFLLFGLVSSDSLCAVWNPVPASQRCPPPQDCCASVSSQTPEICNSDPPVPGTGTQFTLEEDFQFAGDGGYSILLMLGTGTCPLQYIGGASTVNTVILTRGTYTVGVANNIIAGNWTKLTYTPVVFQATLSKTNPKPVFISPGVLVAGPTPQQVGPCSVLIDYLNNATVGCPCNDTWTVGAFDANGVSNATRTINKTLCTYPNGTSSCPEDYYFASRPRYGNFRVTNFTDANNNQMRLLEITRPSFNQTLGWNDSATYANFTANFTCPATVTNTPPTAAKAGAASLVPSLTAAVAVLSVVLW